MRRRLVLWSLAIALAAVWPYRHVPTLSYCGIDTPVLIEINRPASAGELLNCLTREFRDGVEPDVAFYRPWTTLSYVTDAWLWGTSPAGYHLADVALFAASAVLLLLFLVTAGAPVWAAAASAVWLAWHPLAVEVVAVPARRVELWVVVWLLAAGIGWGRDRPGARGWRALWITAAILATLSKETGFVAPLLMVALPSAGRSPVRRLALGLAVIVPGLLLRWLALGRLGGYGAFSVSGVLDGLRILLDVSGGLLGGWILMGVSGLAVLLWRARAQPGVCTLVKWSVAWLAATLVLLCFAGGIGARYLFALLPPLAALLAAASSAGRAARILATAVASSALAGSPAWTTYPQWGEVSRQIEAWGESPPPGGSTIAVAGLPHDLAQAPAPRFRVRSAGIWRDFGLEAAWRLRHGRSPRVIDAAPVRLTQIDAPYAVQVHREGEGWIFTLQGENARFAQATTAGRLEVRGLTDPIYVWNGRALQRVDEPWLRPPKK